MRIRSWSQPLVAALAVTAFATGSAHATDGYFAPGYGMQEMGRGGAAYATADDAMGGANNPASMSFVGPRIDLGMSLFMPSRSASRTGNAYGLNGSADSGSNLFPIPEFGYNQPLSPKLDVGITVYGNGGMNTTYPGGQIPAGHCGTGAPASNLLCGMGTLGIDLSQVVVAPTLSYKFTPHLAFGVSPLLALQRFSAQGLQAFSQVSASPSNLTNRSYSNSVGGGVRIGVMWQATPQVSLGATYQTPIFMTPFSRYQGLFAQSGSFDIPANIGFGVAWKIIPTVRISADYERIFYSAVNSVGNPSTNTALLGTSNGRGFGWQDINVFRLGVDWQATPTLTLRAGYNHGDNPVRARDVTFNILAPGVVSEHLSVGFTYRIAPRYQITFAYTHGFNNSVSGATNPLLPGGGTDTIRLSEDQLGLALGISL